MSCVQSFSFDFSLFLLLEFILRLIFPFHESIKFRGARSNAAARFHKTKIEFPMKDLIQANQFGSLDYNNGAVVACVDSK